MALYLQKTVFSITDGPTIENDPVSTMNSIIRLVMNDPALQMFDSSNGPCLEVIYTPTSSGFSQTRIKELIDLPDIIYVRPRSHDFELNGQPITTWGGITQREPSGVIDVYYDISSDDGYFLYEVIRYGSQETMPYYVDERLFHELSHAYRLAKGLPNTERDAILDENELRGQKMLLVRNPDDPRVQSYGMRVYDLGGCGCFIASAAYGSALDPAVNHFRQIREKVLRSTRLGSVFFEDFFDEYNKFSPAVAEAMAKSTELKNIIREVLVEPLLKFFTLFEKWTGGGWRQTNFGEKALEEIFVNPGKHVEINLSPKNAAEICKVLYAARDRLNHNRAIRGENLPEPPVNPDPDNTLEYILRIIEARVPGQKYLSWALLEPLILYWSTLLRIMDGTITLSEVERAISSEFEGWLATLPLPQKIEGIPPEFLASDLAVFSQNLFAVPPVRHQFGERIKAELAGRVNYDIEALLEKAGYLPMLMIS